MIQEAVHGGHTRSKLRRRFKKEALKILSRGALGFGELSAELLKKYPNLYMSFKISPKDSLPENCPIERGRGLKAEWFKVISDFPNSFIIGSDHFYPARRKPRL